MFGLKNSLGVRAGLALGATVLSMGGGSSLQDDTDGFSSDDWALIEQLKPHGAGTSTIPRNPFNHRDQDMEVAIFAQKLFFETDLAEATTVDGPGWKKG